MHTHKFYTKKGQRLFCTLEHVEGKGSQIIVILCSKDDQYNKKTAIEAYETADPHFHPHVIRFSTRLSGKDFYNFCKKNFYTKHVVERPARYTVLRGESGKEKVLEVRKLKKMGHQPRLPVCLDKSKKCLG